MPEPMILSTWSFGLRGNAEAWPALAAGGSSLDAVETVCRVIDADPEVDSVGFGGLPDRDGRVTLDGCIMLSPDRCGSVCAMSRFLHPASIARRVMERTPHVMLAGEGADAFAEAEGFESAELLSDAARESWGQWQRDPRTLDQSRDRGYEPPPRPVDTGTGGRLFNPDEDRPGGHDTIAALAIDTNGMLAGACSSSGMPYKLPGRVGDSPIIGHGVYVDPAYGAAAATGTGELISGLCSSFLAVEEMRRGATPVDALREALKRYLEVFELRSEHQVAMIAMAPDGRWASGALKDGYRTSITDASRSEVTEPDLVLIRE
jgi:isoaspartyl peptidase/L-asparaginase-like protein (Ntn-hydrolase superfamily)